MNNLLSYCGLIDAKIRASDKDLPVIDVVERLCLGVELKSPLQLKSEKLKKTRVINFQNF